MKQNKNVAKNREKKKKDVMHFEKLSDGNTKIRSRMWAMLVGGGCIYRIFKE